MLINPRDVFRASDACLSHTSGLSREQRGLGRLKLAEVAHVTVIRTPLSRSKGQRSTCRGAGVLWRPPAPLVYSVYGFPAHFELPEKADRSMSLPMTYG